MRMTRFLECGSPSSPLLSSSYSFFIPSLLPHFFTLFFVFSPPHLLFNPLLFISSPPSLPPSSLHPLSPLFSSLSSFPFIFSPFNLSPHDYILIMQTPNPLLPALCMGGTRISPKAAGWKGSSLLCGIQTIQWREGVWVCLGECRWAASKRNRLAHQ